MRGRPTRYLPKYIDEVDKYLETCVDEDIDYHKTIGEKTDSYEKRMKVNLPTMEGFARFINVPRRTVYEWRDKHDEFSHSLGKILDEQQKRLLNSGLSGDYNPTIAKLILSSNHGMSDRADITSGGEKILPQPILGGLPSNNSDKKN